MQIFRIGHGPYCGLIGTCCDDETAEIFQNAKSTALDLLQLASSCDAKASYPKEIQEYLKLVGHDDYPWQYLQAAGAHGLGLGSNQKRCSRAAFLALALNKAVGLAANQVPHLLRGPLSALGEAKDLEAPKQTAWEQPQSEAPEDFQSMFETAWRECQQWLYGFDANAMPDTLELGHVDALIRQNCFIPRKPAHNILMAARGLMLTELHASNKDIIYKSLAGRPWQAMIAGLSDKIRSDLVGPGIREFRLEMRKAERCPYTRDPMAVFVAVWIDGRKVIHHPHATKDEPLRFEDEDGRKSRPPPTKDEMVRAFRLATNWSVQNRWTAFQTGVFQGILRRFRRQVRPDGFSPGDFQVATHVEAWELSPDLKSKFTEFLRSGCGRDSSTASESEADADEFVMANSNYNTQDQADSTNDWCDASHPHQDDYRSNDATWGWDGDSWQTRWHQSSWDCDSSWRSSQWTDWTGSWRGSDWDSSSWQSWEARAWESPQDDQDEDLDTLRQKALSHLGLSDPHENMQLMIKEFLRSELSGSGRILASLDPARDPNAEITYANLITEIEVSRLRYSHDNISRTFLHGEHKGMGIDTLQYELYFERLRTTDVKPLVAVSWKGAVWVICGNRRCHAMKGYVDWLTPGKPIPKARVILHDFPTLPGIQDDMLRWAFMLKAVSSMSTRNEGRDVQVGRTAR